MSTLLKVTIAAYIGDQVGILLGSLIATKVTDNTTAQYVICGATEIACIYVAARFAGAK